jgi:hypothetical protein
MTHLLYLLIISLPGAIKRFEDKSFGMKRIEIVCANCGGHLVAPILMTFTNAGSCIPGRRIPKGKWRKD